MRLAVFQVERHTGAKEYHLIPDTGPTYVRESFEEVLGDLGRIATQARADRRRLSVSFAPDGNVIQHRRTPVFFQEPLTADEQRAVRELFRSIPIPETP